MSKHAANTLFDTTFQQIESLNKICNRGASTQTEAIQLLLEASKVINTLPRYDAVGMDALVQRLRHELKHIHERTDEVNSINKLSVKTRISRTYIARFRDGDMVCMNIMNRIAAAFNIRYIIENYSDPDGVMIE